MDIEKCSWNPCSVPRVAIFPEMLHVSIHCTIVNVYIGTRTKSFLYYVNCDGCDMVIHPSVNREFSLVYLIAHFSYKCTDIYINLFSLFINLHFTSKINPAQIYILERKSCIFKNFHKSPYDSIFITLKQACLTL